MHRGIGRTKRKCAYGFLGFMVSAIHLVAVAQTDVVIQSQEPGGLITFSKAPNAASYRVEWAPTAGGVWTNFAAAAASLDAIVSPGLGVVTARVPMIYRVVAVVTNPPTPPGMALIPAGSFVMGSTTNMGHEPGDGDEQPQHTVHASAFYIDRYKVTLALWDEIRAYASGLGYTFDNEGIGRATNHPVVIINWYDAVKWCNARSENDGLTPVYYLDPGFSTLFKTGQVNPHVNWLANGYRLPTEAEWEKAARGGVPGHRFPWSDSDEIQHARANYNSDGYEYYDTSPTRGYHPTFVTTGTLLYTSPVDYFAPNGYGLHDMTGNASEWCWDWYDPAYYSSSTTNDPRGPAGPLTKRVARCASCLNYTRYVRTANRGSEFPTGTLIGGLRCVRSL